MKKPKRFILKILLGAVLLTVAALISLVIKEALDTSDPEAALPIIEVRCDGTQVSEVYRAAYQWNFFLTTEMREPALMAVSDMPLTPMDVQPSRPVNISFSKTPSSLRVWRAEGRDAHSFTELTVSADGSALLTPATPGVYVYKVYGEWSRGNVLYYFALEVKG